MSTRRNAIARRLEAVLPEISRSASGQLFSLDSTEPAKVREALLSAALHTYMVAYEEGQTGVVPEVATTELYQRYVACKTLERLVAGTSQRSPLSPEQLKQILWGMIYSYGNLLTRMNKQHPPPPADRRDPWCPLSNPDIEDRLRTLRAAGRLLREPGEFSDARMGLQDSEAADRIARVVAQYQCILDRRNHMTAPRSPGRPEEPHTVLVDFLESALVDVEPDDVRHRLESKICSEFLSKEIDQKQVTDSIRLAK